MSKHFITNIRINKLRHLSNINIDLDKEDKKHLIILGKNGSGKTTLLNAICSYLKCIENNQIKFRENTYREWINNFNDEIERLEENTSNKNIRRIQNLREDIRYYEKEIEKYGMGIDIKFSNTTDLNELFNEGKFILAYYKSFRCTDVIISKGVEKVELKNFYFLNDNPSKDFVRYIIDLKAQQSFARNEGEMEVVENIEKWFENLHKAFRTIFDDSSINLKFDYKNYTFKIEQKGRESYGFNELSDGYSSIINIISDIILRMEKSRWNTEGEINYIYDLEGVVLIDEVETHLHYDTQKRIIPFLSSIFPNIQFIITTNSSIVLNLANNCIVCDLDAN